MTDDVKAIQEEFTDPAQKSSGPKPPAEPSNTPPATPVAEDEPKATPGAPEPKPGDAKPEDEPKPADKVEPTEFVKYGDPQADAIVDFIQEAGMTPADAASIFGKANESGNLADIDTAKLTEKLGAAKSQMVMTAVTAYFGKVQAEYAAVDKAVFDAVGGEDNMKTIGTWATAKEASDPTFKAKLDAYRTMLKQGPVQAELAAKELKTLYNADPNNTTLGTKPVQGDSVPTNGTFEPLSKADYFRQMEVATRNRDTKLIEQLNARRLASKAKGY